VTVRELIERLQACDPEGVVGIKASCCPYVHDIEAVRPPKGREIHDDAAVVLEAE